MWTRTRRKRRKSNVEEEGNEEDELVSSQDMEHSVQSNSYFWLSVISTFYVCRGPECIYRLTIGHDDTRSSTPTPPVENPQTVLSIYLTTISTYPVKFFVKLRRTFLLELFMCCSNGFA